VFNIPFENMIALVIGAVFIVAMLLIGLGVIVKRLAVAAKFIKITGEDGSIIKKLYRPVSYHENMASDTELQKINHRIAEIEKIETYNEQMTYVDMKLRNIVNMICENFSAYFKQAGVAGDKYRDLIRENDDFAKLIRSILHRKMREAVFRNGYSEFDESRLEKHIEEKVRDWLNTIGAERRQSTKYPEEIADYLTWSSTQEGQYKTEFRDMFIETAKMHKRWQNEIKQLKAFRAIHLDRLHESGTVLTYSAWCTEEGCDASIALS